MAGVEDQIKQAVAALKAGRKAEARTLLEGIVEHDQRHEQAWFYLSAAVDSLEEQEICLENVLAVNPQNVNAQQGLASLRQKKKQPPLAGTTPGASPKSSAAGGLAGRTSVSIGADSDPFANTVDAESPSIDDQSFDWFGGMPQPTASDDISGTDLDAIPTSVDWGRSDSPAVHGSGQDVEMPSAQEWDAWVQRLNIAQDSPDSLAPADTDADQGPFVMDDDEPFGETPYSADDDRLYADQNLPAAQADDSFGGPSSWFSDFGSDEMAVEESGTDDDPFESLNDFDVPASPRSFAAGSTYAEPVPPVEDDFSFDASELESAGDEEEFDFSFDDDDEDLRADEPASRPARAAQSLSAAALPGAEYYRLIPGEIEPKAGGVELRGLLMLGGVVILLVLNLISFAALLL